MRRAIPRMAIACAVCACVLVRGRVEAEETTPVPALRGGATFAASIGPGAHHAGFGSVGRGALALGGEHGPAAEIGIAALVERTADAVVRSGVRTTGRLRWGDARRSLWIGAAFERMPAEGPVSPPLLGLGFTSRSGAIDITGSFEQTMQPTRRIEERFVQVDTLVQRIVTERDDATPTTAARLDVRWQHGPFTAETVAGISFLRSGPGRWIQTGVSAALSPLLAVEATVGRPPPRWLALDAAPEHRASIGLRVTPPLPGAVRAAPTAPARPEWTMVRARGNRFVFHVRAPGVSTIELTGDWSAWNAVPMRRVGATRWELEVALPPGVHEINLRLDGGRWTPPPGMPSRADGFNGSVGLLIVE